MVLPDGTPSPALARRVRRAITLVRQGQASVLLMTGGPVATSLPESWVMRDLAVAEGISAEKVMVEDCSRNTIENARLTRPIIDAQGWKRVAVVTDAYHLPRSLYIFRRFGIPATGIAATPEGRPARDWWLSGLREVAAFPWTVVRVERKLMGL